ncbi:MAG: lysophospholipid acyltransferase family protein [Lentisphaeria bacterium]
MSTTQKKKHLLARKAVRELPGGVYRLAVLMMQAFRRTWRVQLVDPGNHVANSLQRPTIFSCWHNRLILTPTVIPRKIRLNTAGLASISRDGEYAAQLMQSFGMLMVRGSTSRGGHRALVGLRKKLREGHSIALTPDGPRGPRYEVQPGLVILAEKTECPIVPISLNSKRHWELKGWDKTQIPKPFTRVEMHVGQPLFIPPDLTSEQRTEQCERVHQGMMQITED